MEGKIELREKIILGVLVLLLVVGGVWRVVDSLILSPEITLNDSDKVQGPPVEAEPEMISVHLVGAVENPGVYEMPEGSRIYELLELAGGFIDEADRDFLNQARPIYDGEQVHVPQVGEEQKTSVSGGITLININKATASELTALPGIGDVRAGQIVDHRESQGLFTTIDEIMDVSGIGEATFNNFADLITIY